LSNHLFLNALSICYLEQLAINEPLLFHFRVFID